MATPEYSLLAGSAASPRGEMRSGRLAWPLGTRLRFALTQVALSALAVVLLLAYYVLVMPFGAARSTVRKWRYRAA
jgi:hypothetical protein